MRIFLSIVLVVVALLFSTLAPGQNRITLERSLENTPGEQFLLRGTRFYRNGEYQAAAANFQRAAFWGDKSAQFNLGLMHVNGEGVERNVLLGWAWIELAAERGDSTFREVADDIWRQLRREDQLLAWWILQEKLLPEYGDEVAIDRATSRMKQVRRSSTAGGSRVGVTRVTHVYAGGEDRPSLEFYAADRWDFGKIVELEERVLDLAGRGSNRGRTRITDAESTDEPDSPQPQR
ncbi:MAG: hypothetical protein ACNA7E_09505 [Wenzhouxiangellaceae bacterium]